VALNQNGSFTDYTTVLGTSTLTYPPDTVVTTFTAVYASSMSVAWSANGNGVGVTTYTVVLTTSPIYPNNLGGTVILSTVPAGSSPAATVTGLSAGATYYLFVDARNWNNVSSGYVFLGSTVIAPASQVCFPPGATLVLNSVHGPISITLPPDTFSGCLDVSFSLPSDCPAPPASNVAALFPVGLCVKLAISPAWTPQQPVTVSASYLPGDLTVATTFNTRQLVLAYFASAQNSWMPLASLSGPGSNPVMAQTKQISYFQLMAVIPAAEVSFARVYPNPFRPALGHTTMNFSGLPADARIRIYTLAGELVSDFSTDATGMARWDVTNRSGRAVASGAYFALVQGEGQKTTLKVLVQR